MNPITGKEEWNGTSILNVDDPSKPKLVWHIPNDSNRNSRGVSVVYDYKFDGSGRDYLIRNSEVLTEGETGKDLKYQIFDITSRATDPSKITLVSEITGTPPGSCGPGCGGAFIMRAHKGWWSQDTGYFYAASGEPGFRNVVIQIFDLKDPRAPKFVGTGVASQPEGRRAGLRRPIRPSSGRRRSEQAAVRRLSQLGLDGGVRHRRSREAATGLVARHEPAASRSAHRLADRLRQGSELRSVRAAAQVRVRRRRSRWRRRHGAVPGRRAHRLVHARHHERDQAVPGVGMAGAGWRLLFEGWPLRPASIGGDRQRPDQPVREQDRVARVLQRRHSSAGSLRSRITCRSWATTFRRRTSDHIRSTRSSRSPFRSTMSTSIIAGWRTHPIEWGPACSSSSTRDQADSR